MGARRSLVDLDACIAEVERIGAGAHAPGEEGPDAVALLRHAAEVAARLQALADDLVEEYVERGRLQARSWEEIDEALEAGGRARPAPFRAPHARYAAEEVAAELRGAMREMKAAAVRHRNNYVGTEHVLWGLLWRDTSARRLVRARGGDPDALLDTLERHFGTGAEAAAARIAWTPYARAALARAKELAAGAGVAEIRCDHLLVGLVRLGQGIAANVLLDAGLDASTLSLDGSGW